MLVAGLDLPVGLVLPETALGLQQERVLMLSAGFVDLLLALSLL